MTRTKIKIKNRRPPRPPHTQTKINEISHQNPKGQGRRCDSVFFFSTTIPPKKYLINFYFSSPFFFGPCLALGSHDDDGDFTMTSFWSSGGETKKKKKWKTKWPLERREEISEEITKREETRPQATPTYPQKLGTSLKSLAFCFCFVLFCFFLTKFSFFFLLNQVESIRRRTPPSEQRDRVHSTRIIRWGFFPRFFCTFTDAQHPHP